MRKSRVTLKRQEDNLTFSLHFITNGGFSIPQASDGYKHRLLLAGTRNTALYMPRYAGAISPEKAAGYASLHAVLAEAASIYNAGMINVYSNVLSPLHEAFNAIYPNKYSYHRFARYMREAQTGDIFNIVVDCSVLNKLTPFQSERIKFLCLSTLHQRKFCYYISM